MGLMKIWKMISLCSKLLFFFPGNYTSLFQQFPITFRIINLKLFTDFVTTS